MARNSADERLVQSKLSENEVVEEEEEEEEEEEKEEEEEEEALSLCDLPINGENQSRKEEAQPIKNEEDFDFVSLGGRSLLTESEMCAADKVFFQGQILPLRHSVSSESGLAMFRTDSRSLSRCVSRSESMDHSCFTSTVSSRNTSRSSSIRSHNSSNSCGSITTPTTTHKQQQRVRNQFHSHPSPSPQIRPPSGRFGNNSSHRSSTPKSTVWSFFRVGLLKTPGIELEDLKVRGNNSSSTNKNFGSRNSTSSTSSSICNSKSTDKNGPDIEKRNKQKLFQFGGGCKCSVDAVLDTVPSSRVVVASNNANEGTKRKKTTKQQQQRGKQSMSRRRTFEWLKELSLAGVPDEA